MRSSARRMVAATSRWRCAGRCCSSSPVRLRRQQALRLAGGSAGLCAPQAAVAAAGWVGQSRHADHGVACLGMRAGLRTGAWAVLDLLAMPSGGWAVDILGGCLVLSGCSSSSVWMCAFSWWRFVTLCLLPALLPPVQWRLSLLCCDTCPGLEMMKCADSATGGHALPQGKPLLWSSNPSEEGLSSAGCRGWVCWSAPNTGCSPSSLDAWLSCSCLFSGLVASDQTWWGLPPD